MTLVVTGIVCLVQLCALLYSRRVMKVLTSVGRRVIRESSQDSADEL